MSYSQKYKELKQRLDLLPTIKMDTATNSKIRNIQSMVTRLNQTYKEDCLKQDYRIKMIQEKLIMLQGQLKQQQENLQAKRENNKARVMKNGKKLEKTMEKWVKERRECDEKIQHCLHNYLLQLASTKTKGQTGASILLKEFASLQNAIDQLERKVHDGQTVNKELLQRIYSQFSRQMEEMEEFLREERRDQEAEEERAIQSLERLYKTMQNKLKIMKKQRQTNEKQLIDLLEKVIEKITVELIQQ